MRQTSEQNISLSHEISRLNTQPKI